MAFHQPRPQGDAAPIRELDGIGSVVEQCLLDACRVAAQPVWQGLHVECQPQAFLFGLGLDHVVDVGDDVIDGETDVLQLQLTRLDLG